jgi:hypothetical protein
VRDLDRNCPWNRYTPIPVSRDPYCAGAFTPAGAAALVTAPQEHALDTRMFGDQPGQRTYPVTGDFPKNRLRSQCLSLRVHDP